MQKSLLKSWLMMAVTALAVAFVPQATAQLTTSGMTGVVRSNDGNPVAGATVTALFTPTNTTFRATTNEAGRYYFRGLPVGGPYTVAAAAEGLKAEPIADVTTALGIDIEVNVVIAPDVVKLEAFRVTGDRAGLDANAQGTGSTLTSEQLGQKPTSERSLADMISSNSLVTLRDTSGDREESQITALGQNNRFNSIQIDGSRINDLFGLNATGLASFFNPLSLDTIEQLAVQLSPYDVRQAGFTGASVNAVTKSGTNQFHGSVYGYWRGDSMFGIRTQGYNARENFLTGAKVYPRLERRTYGATLGGPIWKDHVFFFVNWEDFKSDIDGRDPRFSTPLEADILARLNQYSTAAGKTIAWGNPVTGRTSNLSTDKKINAKVDWQINSDHKLTVRYTTTEGEVPQFGNFGSGGTNLNSATGSTTVTTTPDGHFYAQERIEKTWTGQLVSQWTPDFKTEIRYSTTKQDQDTPLNTVAPMLVIGGVTGTDLLNNTAITTGAYVAGTEQFRHGNVIRIDSEQMSATGDYFWQNFVFTGGVERESFDSYNLFRNGSYGLVAFRNYTDFLNDVAVITRNVYDPNVRNVADVSQMATNGVFGQARWDVNSRLSITAGLRYEFVESSIAPPLNQAFLTATGFRNDGTPDGSASLSPRIGFNYAVDGARRTQVRGGVGHFFGRAPWVIFSNSFGQTGVGTFTLSSATGALPTSLTAYLKNSFDPSNPIGTGTDNPALVREVNFVDPGVEFPQSWRGNLAVEHRLPFLDSVVTVEAVHSMVDKALFVTNENLIPTTKGADGRQRFNGAPSSTTNRAGAKYAGYLNIIRVQNTDVGESTYYTVQWSRPMKNKWAFDLSYTRGSSTDAQSIGQTTAGGQWFRNAVFNQNTVEEGTSDFEIKDRVQLNLSRQFEFVKKWKTTASLYYEGRTGNPYSWVFGGDLNGDGQTFNDVPAIPSGIDDPRFDFSGMTTAQRDAFLAYIDRSELAAYKGGIAPKNAFTEPWVNRLDLKFIQDVPVYGPAKLQLFFDFINLGAFISRDTFGYYEIAPFLSNGVFRTRTLTGTTTYGTDGRIKPTYTAEPSGFNIDNGMSRWRIQVGAKLLF